jgi:peptidyl-tRNA hydrolase, PTH1 family
VGIGEAHWLVAGLGNPGSDYVRSRHNLGFAVVERLAEDGSAKFAQGSWESEVAGIRVSAVPVVLIKPQTYMNRSGAAVAAWLERFGLPPARLVVVHDELDLPLGRLRIAVAAGAGGHRGVRSVQDTLGTTEFPRVRLGIGRPDAGEAAADRVLADFGPEEMPTIAAMVARAVEAVRSLIREGAARAMNRYNVRVGSSDPPPGILEA